MRPRLPDWYLVAAVAGAAVIVLVSWGLKVGAFS